MEPPIRILLIEDNPGDARLIDLMVREIDQPLYQLDRVDCLVAAWKALARTTYQVILLDLHLPDSQGIRTFEEVAQHLPRLPVVVLTGVDDLKLAIQLVRQGAQDYLVKGQINEKSLSKAIQYAIERKYAELELYRSNRALRTLSDCNQILVSAANEAELLQSICRTIVEVGGYSLAWVGYVEEGEEKKGKPVAFFGPGGELLEAMPISWGDNEREHGLCGTAIRTNKPAIVRDRTSEPPGDPWHQEALQLGLRSALSLPLRKGERPFGALTICSKVTEVFDAEEVGLLLELAGDLAYGILSLRTKLERDRGLEALQESEERLQRAINATQDGLWEWDIDSNLEYCSPRWCEILGYSFDDPALPHTFDAWASRIHPDDYDRVIAAQRSHLEKGSKYDVDYRHLHRSGEYRWQNSKGLTVLDAHGKPAKMVGCISDITDRKQAEEALLREQTMLARTEGIAKVGSWEWDIATDTVIWSDELFRIFQRDPREGAPSFAEHPTIYHPEGMARLQQAVEAAVTEGTPYELELRAIRKDGETRECVARGVAEMGPGGRAVRLFGSLQDITERKRAEEALRESEALLEEVGEMARVGGWQLDVETKQVFWTSETYRIHEVSEGESIDLPKALLFFDLPERSTLEAALKHCMETGQPFDLELPFTSATGTHLWTRAIGNAVKTDDKVTRLKGTFQDISGRKQLEQVVEKARADFLFAVSHELKTPLHAMGITQEMIESLPEELRLAQFRDSSDIWRRNLMRLRFIIENLVDSQRPTGMGLKLEKQPTNLMDLAREIAGELEPLASARSVQLRFQGEPLPPTSLDRNAVRRLLENLLTNAIKFSHLGGEVKIRLQVQGETVCLEVCDFGMGIDPQIRPFLFQPFYRSPEASKAGVQGTGLGLYVSKTITEAHGGTIQLESELGKGTTVTVRLPLLEETQ